MVSTLSFANYSQKMTINLSDLEPPMTRQLPGLSLIPLRLPKAANLCGSAAIFIPFTNKTGSPNDNHIQQSYL